MNCLAHRSTYRAANVCRIARFLPQGRSKRLSIAGVDRTGRIPGILRVAARAAVPLRSEGASTFAVATGARSFAVFRGLMAPGRVLQRDRGVLPKQGSMAHGAIEFHPFGVKKVKEGNTALAGCNHQPDGEYLFSGGSRRQRGQRTQNQNSNQTSHVS